MGRGTARPFFFCDDGRDPLSFKSMERTVEFASHRFEAHTGEVRLVLSAPDLPALFSQAASGLAELMAEDAQAIPLVDRMELEVEGRDLEALLVNWLDELIYRTEIEGRVYPRVEWMEVEEGHLRARVSGGPPKAFKTSVKAATFHGLTVRNAGGRFEAAVVLDV